MNSTFLIRPFVLNRSFQGKGPHWQYSTLATSPDTPPKTAKCQHRYV